MTFRFVGKIKHFFWGVKVHLLTYWQLKEHITRGKFWHISLSKQSFSNLDPFIFSKLWFTSIWANFWRIFFINLPLGWVKPTSTSVKVELDSRNRQQSKARIRSVLDRFWRLFPKPFSIVNGSEDADISQSSKAILGWSRSALIAYAHVSFRIFDAIFGIIVIIW